MGLFFAFCPNFYCGCRVEISTQEGGAAQCQPSRLKLELRCTTKGRRDPQGASPPSLFLSLLLLPLPFCFSSLFSSSPPPPFLLLLLCLSQIWTSRSLDTPQGALKQPGESIFMLDYKLRSRIPWRRKWPAHSSILAWEIPWTEENGGLQSMGS